MLRPGDRIWAGIGQLPLVVAHVRQIATLVIQTSTWGFMYYNQEGNITLRP